MSFEFQFNMYSKVSTNYIVKLSSSSFLSFIFYFLFFIIFYYYLFFGGKDFNNFIEIGKTITIGLDS